MPSTLLLEAIRNTIVIFAICYAYALTRPRLSSVNPKVASLVDGLIFGLIAALGILAAPVIGGLLADPRVVIIGIAGAFGGGITVISAALIAIVFRLLVGGDTLLPGIGAIIVAAAMGYLFYLYVKRLRPKRIGLLLCVLGIALGLQEFLWVLLLSLEDNQQTLDLLLLPALLIFPLGTYMLGSLLMRERHEYRIREVLHLTDSAVQYCADGILVVTPEQIINVVNFATACLFGYADDLEEVEAMEAMKTKPIMSLFSEAARPLYLGEVERAAAESRSDAIGKHVEGEGLRLDGSVFRIRFSVAPIRDDGKDKLRGFVIVIRDISQTHEQVIQENRLKLEQDRVRLLQQFVGDASHDLKTPLTTISTSAYLLTRHADKLVTQATLAPEARNEEDVRQTGADIRNRAQQLETNVMQLKSLIGDLLNMARLDNDDPLSPSQVNLNELVTRGVDVHQGLATERSISLNAVLEDQPLPVLVESAEFERALDNLITNALVYTNVGGRVEVTTRNLGETVAVEISDTGIGISEKDLPHIFNRFYRANSARTVNTGGTGLGLAITKKVVEAHGGQLTVESTPNEGTRFRITLPAAPPEPAPG